MVNMLSYLFCIFCLIITKSQVVNIPVTYALDKVYSAPITKADAWYFQIDVCKQATGKRTKAQLSLILPDNVYWNTTTQYPIVVVQVSKCKDSFTSECVFAQNYKYGAHVEATPVISWYLNITNETVYYLRVMAINKPVEFSMELTFGNDYDAPPYPWTTNSPFDGTIPTTSIQNLTQYWRAYTQYNVANDGPLKQFFLAFCPQARIKGISVATTTLPNSKKEYLSLIQQWACSSTINIEDCTTTNYNWYNHHWAGFDLLQCNDEVSATEGGIYVIVEGGGSNLDGSNLFVMTASLIL